MYRNFTQTKGIPPGYIHKILLVMRLTTLILITTMMTVSAASLAQKVTLNEKNATLKQTLLDIRKQTSYDFVLTDELLNTARQVSINIKNTDLKTALDQIFSDQPLTFTIDEKIIIIKEKQASFIDKIKAFIAASDVTGRITDENNQPLSGATIGEKGTSNSTTSDANGFFTLKQVQPNATLVISYIGYDKREIAATPNVGAVKLTVATSKLDEVKVIAYGQTTERLSTGNVSSVSAKDIENHPVTNPLLALQGQVPGLYITQGTGLPGTAVNVTIQGQNSIGFGNNPYYVVDGVPYFQLLLPNSGIVLGNSGDGPNQQNGNPLSFINPSDIESISVLKDAEATAIYGSRAANGAILITTKKGRAGVTRFDGDVQTGWSKDTRRLNLLNTAQYLAIRNQALVNDNKTAPSGNQFDINGTWDQTRYTDWQKELVGGTAKYTDAHANLSGGNSNTQFLIGTTYHRETTVFPGDFADQKAGMHVNLNNSSANNKFHIEFITNFQYDDNRLPSSDPTRSITLAPDAPPLRNSAGGINWAPNSNGGTTFSNPLGPMSVTYDTKTNMLATSLNLSYQLLDGLQFRTTLGYNLMFNKILIATPRTSIFPEAFAVGNATYIDNQSNIWNVEPQLNYKKSFGKHNLDILLGATGNQVNSNGQSINGTQYISDDLLSDIHSAATTSVNSTFISTYKYNAIFGRINYNWAEKYLLSFSLRRDGSSRFGPASEFHNFGSASGAWIFSEERFIKENFSFLSFGKFKVSYGTTGNDQIGDYGYLSLYRSNTATVPYQGVNAVTPDGLSNPYLQWEETRKLNLGLELTFINNRFLIDVNYFRNRSSNELLDYPLPIITGFGSITKNLPATVQNTGLELALQSVNFKSKNFRWVSNATFTIPRNRLIAFPDLPTSSYANTLVIGQPVSITKVYNLIGVDPATGIYQFRAANGATVSTPNPLIDRTKLVDQNPQFYGGLKNTISYKNFQLDFLFSFTKKVAGNLNYGFFSPGANNTNQPVSVLSAWSKPGDAASIAKYSNTLPNFGNYISASNASDAHYSDASYVRLKNASLSWSLPENWNHRLGTKSIRVIIEGQNLLTMTKYNGLDPELAFTGLALPPLKTILLGIKLGL